MFIIERKQDLEVLKSSNIINNEYMEEIENQFKILFEQIKDEEEISLDEFSLQLYGYIIILEKGDNLRNLSPIGLDSNSGLIATIPEFIDELLFPGTTVYKVLVVYNNSYAVTFFIPASIVDDELQKWIDENIKPLT